VFVDSPSGTGYSYSNTTSDYSVFTDQSTGMNFLALSCSLIINLSEKSDILDSFLSILMRIPETLQKRFSLCDRID
jgi:hypothetical protein